MATTSSRDISTSSTIKRIKKGVQEESIPPTSPSPGQEILSILEETDKPDEQKRAEREKQKKLQQLKACLELVEASENTTPETKQQCGELVERFDEFITVQKKDAVKFRAVYLRTLFSLMRLYYRDGAEQNQSENELADRLTSVLDCLPNSSPLKRNCLIGAIYLADNQALKFYDFLKRMDIEFDQNVALILCQIAHATKNASILEPILEMPISIRRNLTILVKCYEQAALIYGQSKRMDKLEWLWQNLFKTKGIRRNDRIMFKAALHRIAHFYRIANRKVPEELAKQMRRMDGHHIAYYPPKREQSQQK